MIFSRRRITKALGIALLRLTSCLLPVLLGLPDFSRALPGYMLWLLLFFPELWVASKLFPEPFAPGRYPFIAALSFVDTF